MKGFLIGATILAAMAGWGLLALDVIVATVTDQPLGIVASIAVVGACIVMALAMPSLVSDLVEDA
jgi:hypothetical protein